MTRLPSVPSIVLPGLIAGASLCRPIALPTAYAPVSVTQTVSSVKKSSSRPSGTSCSSTKYEARPPRYSGAAIPHSHSVASRRGSSLSVSAPPVTATTPTMAPSRYSSPKNAATGNAAVAIAESTVVGRRSVSRAAANSRVAMQTANATTAASNASPTHTAPAMSGMPIAAVIRRVTSNALR